ncbi:MAG: exosortase family protein XrtM [Burkholderiales bacterium]
MGRLFVFHEPRMECIDPLLASFGRLASKVNGHFSVWCLRQFEIRFDKRYNSAWPLQSTRSAQRTITVSRAFTMRSNDTKQTKPWVFLLVFPAVYGLLHFLYFALPDHMLRNGVHYYGIVLPAAGLLNFFAPLEAVSANAGSLHSARASLEIVRGCDGAGVMFLLVAAMTASNAGFRKKLLGILGGMLLIYILNELRVIALYFVVAYRGEWFGPLHNYFVPMLMIVTGILFFLWWTTWAPGTQRRSEP